LHGYGIDPLRIGIPELIQAVRDCVSFHLATSDVCDEFSASTDDPGDPDWVDADPDDAALILYTSGTTGFAKGATLSHGNVRSNVCAFNHLCAMQPDDRILLTVPLFHCFGQNALLNSALNVGATIVLQRRFELQEAKQLIKQHQITQLYGVPLMFQLFLDRCNPEDLSSINYCFSAAATLPIQTAQNWQNKFGLPINEGYGLTETSPFASYNHRLRFQPGSIGTPIDAVEMKIVDTETGLEVGPGQLGEIAIRGPNVMLGYWNREEDTRAAIRDGWLYSGDIGRQDEHGFLYIVDRVKDMISVGALKVYPAEVERVLLDHPAVAQAAVVGVADEVFGEQVIAFVVLQEATRSEPAKILASLRAHSQSKLANYKMPRHLYAVSELPRNPSGKVLKTQLREQGLSRLRNDPQTLPQPEKTKAQEIGKQWRSPSLKEQLASSYENRRHQVATTFLQELIREIQPSVETVDPSTRFLDAGLDSMMIVEMSTQIQTELDEIEVSPTMVFDHPRLEDLAAFLVDQLCHDSQVPAIELDAKPDTRNDESSTTGVRSQVETLTEDEALEQLMRELEE
jgi:long-chain acyl-CoA synthetase